MNWIEIVNLVAALLLGFILVPLIQWLKGCDWPAAAKQLLAVVICGLVGVAQVWVAGDILGLLPRFGEITAAEIVAIITTVYSGAQIFYHTYWKATATATKLEQALWSCKRE